MTPVDIKEMFERSHVEIKDAETTQEAKDKEAKCQKFTLVKRYLKSRIAGRQWQNVFVDKNLTNTIRYRGRISTEREAMVPKIYRVFKGAPLKFSRRTS